MASPEDWPARDLRYLVLSACETQWIFQQRSLFNSRGELRGEVPPDRDQRAALRWAVWMSDGDPFRRAKRLVDNADDALRWLLVQGALDGRPIDL